VVEATGDCGGDAQVEPSDRRISEPLAVDVTPRAVRPAGQRIEFIAAFAESLTGVFLYGAPLVAVAFALPWLRIAFR
jgi:hypothetical protein